MDIKEIALNETKRMQAEGWAIGDSSGVVLVERVIAEIAKQNKPLEDQLAAAQEENGRLENQVLARDAELWGRTQEILGLKDQLTKAEQLWQVAKGRCDGLEEKLAKAEQRVAEAIATMFDESGTGGIFLAEMVRNSEWRKFVKEV